MIARLRKHFFILCCLVFAFLGALGQGKYTNGVFLLNEDWFPSENGSVNFLNFSETPPFWDYRVYRKENPEKEFGLTTQFGTIYGGNFFVMSKQASEEVEGGRLVVADAQTLKRKAFHLEFMVNAKGESMADGRACVGVDEKTLYVGTSNGIFVYDIPSHTVGERIPGTENPLVQGGEEPASGSGPLYNNQIGNMIRGSDYVFAVYQDSGILVIDPSMHEVIKVIEGCYSTLLLTPDGKVNAARNMGEKQEYPYGNFGDAWSGTRLVRIDQHTLDTVGVPIPKEFELPQSWYAWTKLSVCAAKTTNTLYWVKRPSGMFGSTGTIFKLDLDVANPTPEVFYEYPESEGISVYGAGIEVSPDDEYLYLSLNQGAYSSNFLVSRIRFADGSEEGQYVLTNHYWFPAMFIFPDNESPVLQPSKLPEEIVLSESSPSKELDLSDAVTDADNLCCAIVKSCAVGNSDLVSASIKHDKLTVSCNSGVAGSTDLELRFNSNGKILAHTLPVRVESSNPIESLTLTPTEKLLYVGDKFSLTFAVQPDTELNRKVEWKSSADDIVSVSATGELEAHKPGEAIVTVTSLQNAEIRQACHVRVSPRLEGIILTESTLALRAGDEVTITASSKPEGVLDFAVVWETSASEVLSIAPDGLSVRLAAMSAGTATVTAKHADFPDLEGRCVVAVEQLIVPVEFISFAQTPSAVLYVKAIEQLEVNVQPGEATNRDVEWSSSNEEVAMVSGTGLVTACGKGQTTITVKSRQNPSVSISYELDVHVAVESIVLSSRQLQLNRGDKKVLVAMVRPEEANNRAVKWESSNEEVVSVSAVGELEAIAAGDAVITVTSLQNAEIKQVCRVQVQVPVESFALEPNSLALKKGETKRLTPIVEPRDATNQLVAWSSKNKDVAAVDRDGLVTATGVGETYIVALIAGGKEAIATVTVTDPTPAPQPEDPVPVESFAHESYTLSPNPTSGQLYIKGLKASVEVFILSLQGAEVLRATAYPEQPLSLGHLPKGIYLLRTADGATLRLMLE